MTDWVHRYVERVGFIDLFMSIDYRITYFILSYTKESINSNLLIIQTSSYIPSTRDIQNTIKTISSFHMCTCSLTLVVLNQSLRTVPVPGSGSLSACDIAGCSALLCRIYPILGGGRSRNWTSVQWEWVDGASLA